jgi:hypothetical protein
MPATQVTEGARATAGARVWVHRADEAMARSGKATKTDGKVRTYLLRAEFYRTGGMTEALRRARAAGPS